jgi:tellurite resistance protein TerC
MVRRTLISSYRAARKLTIATIGASVVALGVAMLVLPGPAILVIPLGLAVLALEFAWARRWLERLRDGSRSVLRWIGTLSPRAARTAIFRRENTYS